MLYIIKVLYGSVIFPPGIFIIALLALAAWSWRKNRKVGKVLLTIGLLFYIASIGVVAGSVVRSLESKYKPPEQVNGDVIIMLGGGATLDTPNLGWQGHLGGAAANRLLTSAQLYNKLGVPVIVSGGRVLATTGLEADVARNILLGLGIPSEKVILEDASLNTTQNAQNVAKILKEKGFKSPILVTSAFHMERSVLQFKKAGVEVTPVPAGYMTNISARTSFFDFLPSAGALDAFSMGLKEYLGIVATRWY